jgi:hypothetical protein|tara:strand:+ start:340 stop:843 length:504 start_codon:yes stop_codon:yes gene_type:complete
LYGTTLRYWATLGGTVTTMAAHEARDAPSALDDSKEDTVRFGGVLGGEKNGARKNKNGGDTARERARRCRILGDPKTAKDYVYNATDVYTFDYMQSVILFDEYALDLWGIARLPLERHVNGQPLGIMAKHRDGRYVYSFEIMHECLLAKNDQAPPGWRVESREAAAS